MELGKTNPEWKETDFTASSYQDGFYNLAVGEIRISLTEEEFKRHLETWKENNNA